MIKSIHACYKHPSYRSHGSPWKEGTLDDCPYHGKRIVNQSKIQGIEKEVDKTPRS